MDNCFEPVEQVGGHRSPSGSPLLRIDELIEYINGAKFFTKLELKSRYHQIPIESTYVWKPTFNTKEGLFEWLVMPFSLTNACGTFMRYMDNLL